MRGWLCGGRGGGIFRWNRGGLVLEGEEVGGGGFCGAERGGDFDGVSGAIEDLDESAGADLAGAEGFSVLNDRYGDGLEEGGAGLGLDGEGEEENGEKEKEGWGRGGAGRGGPC